MKRVLIGHRGTGKTSLLKRHQQYFPQVEHYDLDAEIEKVTESPISKYFTDKGESGFRKKEAEAFQKLIKQENFVIAVGAGFDVTQIPQDLEIIFVSRATDQDGRLFLNRPRLEPQLTALEEYKKRFSERNTKFVEQATWTYDLPEGIETENQTEKQILTENFQVKDSYLTLTEKDLPRIANLIRLFKKIELRTDLLTEKSIRELIKNYPQHDFLLSIRNVFAFDEKTITNVDCDLNYFNAKAKIISSHLDSIDQSLQKFTEIPAQYHLKLCPLIETFEDLIKGFEWQQQAPENRSFLPRSKNGRWVWYRKLSKYFQKINFVKNFHEVLDQPTLFEWLSLPEQKPKGWAAVLGYPVYFSRSPLQHYDFFTKRNSFFAKIDLSSIELKKHYRFLIQLGLQYAAVTSPLKETLFEIAEAQTPEASQLKAANTLWVSNHKVSVHNTDLTGFQQLVKAENPKAKIAIWGGGGTLEMLKAVLPQAVLFSSQSGQQRTPTNEQITHFEALVWAAPRNSQTQFPSESLNFDRVIDLNYTENSMGLEFAVQRKIGYISGLEMFKAQAQAQQVFWQAQEGQS